MAGFATFKRDGLNLPSDFTATINADMRVGGLEETITVSGDAQTVDVSSTARVQVLDREVLDAIPNGRSIFSTAQLVAGVNLNVPDVGGSRAMQQTYMSTRGAAVHQQRLRSGKWPQFQDRVPAELGTVLQHT